jgi:hypothetical protein
MVALYILLCVMLLQVERRRRKKSQIEVKSGRGAIAHGE